MSQYLDRMDVFLRLTAACKAEGGQGRWAAKHEVSPQYVGDVLNGRTAPGESILKALGLTRVVRYLPVKVHA